MKRSAPLKRGKPLARKTRLRPRSKRNSYRKRERDLPYLRWIRSHRTCAACLAFGAGAASQVGPVEAAHRDVGGKAMSHKTPDHEALPLCRACHRAPGMHRNPMWQEMTKPARRDWWMIEVAWYRGVYLTMHLPLKEAA